MKIHIVGVRPHMVKLHEFYDWGLVLHTGQHFEKTMKEEVLELDCMHPKNVIDLDLQTSSILDLTDGIEKTLRTILRRPQPIEEVVVYGDANSTLAGALAAKSLGLYVTHIEGGLRCGSITDEESNRIAIDHLADYHVAPTDYAITNLIQMGVPHEEIGCGLYMLETIQKFAKLAEEKTCKFVDFTLLTIHRRENLEGDFEGVLKAIDLACKNVVFPIHPHTQSLYYDNPMIRFKNIIAERPLPYIDFMNLLVNCDRVITDSGGVQYEAAVLEKPCYVLRDETEWQHLIGPHKLLGFRQQEVFDGLKEAVGEE